MKPSWVSCFLISSWVVIYPWAGCSEALIEFSIVWYPVLSWWPRVWALAATSRDSPLCYHLHLGAALLARGHQQMPPSVKCHLAPVTGALKRRGFVQKRHSSQTAHLNSFWLALSRLAPSWAGRRRATAADGAEGGQHSGNLVQAPCACVWGQGFQPAASEWLPVLSSQLQLEWLSDRF